MKIKCLIVDDETLAQKVVEKYAYDIPSLEVVAKAKNAMQALDILHTTDIDLMFLDINMPKLSGLSFLKTLKNPPLVVITTAYREYAYEGFELDVVDYLKKPFSFERFLMAINKVQEKMKPQSTVSNYILNKPARQQIDESFIFLKSEKKTYKIDLKEILFIESVGDYVKVYTKEKVILSYYTLKKLESMLSNTHFPRVHKSYIVSISKINSFEGNQIKIQDQIIPIGRNYKQSFNDLIEHFSS